MPEPRGDGGGSKELCDGRDCGSLQHEDKRNGVLLLLLLLFLCHERTAVSKRAVLAVPVGRRATRMAITATARRSMRTLVC